MPPLAMYVADIAHEVIYRLKEGNSTKWLFSSILMVLLESPITPERKTATGLVIAPPVWELTDFFPQNTPKNTKTAICRASITTYKRLLLTQKVREVKV
jgi:hypothetical protein